MSIIGEGKYVNYVGQDSRPSWQRMERYDYCEISSGKKVGLLDRIANFLKDLQNGKAA